MPVSTLTTSEYWGRCAPDDLRREIARRTAEPRAKEDIAKALSSERLQFKILWNRSLVINQLPNELLIQIFKLDMVYYGMCIAISDTYERRSIEKPRPSFWRLMMVCRHWREVIVGTPAFWSLVHLTGTTIEWTELFLARSAAALIDVVVEASISYSRCCLEHFQTIYPLIQDRIERLYFKIRVFNGDMDPDVFAALPLLFGNGMRELERLEFAVVHERRRPYYLPIDVELTCQRFPRLRHLALAGVVAPQEASFYQQIRTLCLTTCTHNLSCDGFLDVLASCTGLECLYLQKTIEHLSGDWVQRDPVPWRPLISLPRLHRFSLGGREVARISRFLAQFYVRPSVNLSIWAHAEDAEDTEAPSSHGARSMAAMLPPSYADTLQPLAMVTEIHMWMGGSVAVEISAERPARLSLSMTLSSYAGRPCPVALPRWGSVGDIVRFLGHAPLTSLKISEVLPDTVAAWASVFRTFVLLERLHIMGFVQESPAGMENAFLGLHAASAGSSAADSPVACPSLTHIRVHCVGSTALYEAIYTCVRHRGDKGAVLVDLDLDILWGRNRTPSSCRAYIKDLLDCTKRLNLPGLSMDEIGAGEDLRGAEEDSGVRQGDYTPGAFESRFRVNAHCVL